MKTLLYTLIIFLIISALFIPRISSFIYLIITYLQPYSGLLNVIVTLLVGLVAFILYYKQKRDNKKEAANTILLEIQSAERALKKVKEILREHPEGPLSEDIFVMQQESWSKYRNLFVKDFERDDWDEITDFYFRCRKYDEAVSYNNSLFRKNEEQIRINITRLVSDMIVAQKNKTMDQQKLNDFKTYFKNDFLKDIGEVSYYPKKPLLDAHRFVDDLNINITQTRIGIKLRKLAGLKN